MTNMIKMNLEDRARCFATEKHKGQLRKDQHSEYISHPAVVVELLRTYVSDISEEALAAAWLHDTVEDCNVTLDEIRRSFGEKVFTFVDYLTERKLPIRNKEKYVRRIIREAPIEAKFIKLADAIHNVCTIKDIRDANLREKSYQTKTREAVDYYLPLAGNVSPSMYVLLKASLIDALCIRLRENLQTDLKKYALAAIKPSNCVNEIDLSDEVVELMYGIW